MQRREDLAGSARLGRAPPAAATAAAGRLQSPQAAASPRRPPRGAGGARGAQPPPLLPPSATGSVPPAHAAAPTPLMPPAAAKAEPENSKYLPELMAEKDSLDPSFTHATQLLQAGERGVGEAGGRWSRLGRARGASQNPRAAAAPPARMTALLPSPVAVRCRNPGLQTKSAPPRAPRGLAFPCGTAGVEWLAPVSQRNNSNKPTPHRDPPTTGYRLVPTYGGFKVAGYD